MQKQKQLEELYAHKKTINSKIQQLEHDIQKEKYRNDITKNANKVHDVIFHHDKESDEYYLGFYDQIHGNSAPETFRMTKDQLHDLLTIIHNELEEHEIPKEDQDLMKLLDHFFHINNFKPIRLNHGSN